MFDPIARAVHVRQLAREKRQAQHVTAETMLFARFASSRSRGGVSPASVREALRLLKNAFGSVSDNVVDEGRGAIRSYRKGTI
jgi:hypothetical protein